MFHAPQNDLASAFIVTIEFDNLFVKSDYHGENNLTVGNGNKLPITIIGHTKIYTLSIFSSLFEKYFISSSN